MGTASGSRRAQTSSMKWSACSARAMRCVTTERPSNARLSGSVKRTHDWNESEILASVVHTARPRRLDTREVLVDLLRARQPFVSPALNLPQ